MPDLARPDPGPQPCEAELYLAGVAFSDHLCGLPLGHASAHICECGLVWTRWRPGSDTPRARWA